MDQAVGDHREMVMNLEFTGKEKTLDPKGTSGIPIVHSRS